MTNHFETASEEGKVASFLLGEGRFFISDREVPELHSFFGSWRKHLAPLLTRDEFLRNFWQGMSELLCHKEDPNYALFAATRHLYLYLYFGNQCIPRGFISQFLKRRRELEQELLVDKRWSGADWNTRDGGGLSTVISRELERIASKFNITIVEGI